MKKQTITSKKINQKDLGLNKSKPLQLKKNLKRFNKVSRIIPNCSQTFSKSYTQFSFGVCPIFVREGKGCYLYDIDGNKFIDYTMGLGPSILGYNYPPVNNAIKEQLKKGISFTLPHYLEGELAEKLCEIIPSAEMVRFGKNGSDVTSAAVRVARAFTGRDYILCCGYHGWQDWYIATTTRNRGIPEDIRKLTLTFKYNDIEGVEKIFDEYHNKIACVIMEPVGLVPPKENFLQRIREICSKNNTLLIFDEVVTGFRFSLGGAQEFFGVTPDLSCFGKAMGNGMPISAVVGKREIMKLFDEVFFSFTFGGETLSLAAAISTINEIRKNKVINLIWKNGEILKKGINDIIVENKVEDLTKVEGYSPRFLMSFQQNPLKLKTLFQQECVRRGLLFSGAHNISLPHTENIINKTLDIYREVIMFVKKAVDYEIVDKLIDGRIVEPVFRTL